MGNILLLTVPKCLYINMPNSVRHELEKIRGDFSCDSYTRKRSGSRIKFALSLHAANVQVPGDTSVCIALSTICLLMMKSFRRLVLSEPTYFARVCDARSYECL